MTSRLQAFEGAVSSQEFLERGFRALILSVDFAKPYSVLPFGSSSPPQLGFFFKLAISNRTISRITFNVLHPLSRSLLSC